MHDHSWAVVKSHWSPIWRSVGIGLQEIIFPGYSWVLGDGRSVKFWTDKWLMGAPMTASATGPLPAGYENMTVRDLWSGNGGWDLEQITHFVPHNRHLELLAAVVDMVCGGRDRLVWGEKPDGVFTVKTAYALLTRDETPRTQLEDFYVRVWRVKVPERVRSFLWLVSHQVIMTNVERYRCHLSNTAVCQVCKGGLETILHVLRDCPAIQGIWLKLVPKGKQQSFFSMTLFEWMYENLGANWSIENGLWSTMFAMGVWWAWKWRCGNVFGDNRLCKDRVKFVKRITHEVNRAFAELVGHEVRVERVQKLVGWVKLQTDWVRLNTDGAARGNPGLATAGGVLRNNNGEWCKGFALNIGRCAAPLAELWGVYYGLYLAWEIRSMRVELEVDSELVVGFLKDGIGDSHALSFLVRLCHGFLKKDWIVRISHIYREANHLADELANYTFYLPLGLHTFDVVLDFCAATLRADALETLYPRQVIL